MLKNLLLPAFAAALAGGAEPPSATAATTPTLTVQTDRPGAKINPALWGIFFEDINFGADGGLYAELVKNRGFEFPDPMMGWTKISTSVARGQLTIRDDDGFDPANPHYVRIHSESKAHIGISNEGFRGIGLRDGETYDFSAEMRLLEGAPRLNINLVGGDGTMLASVTLTNLPSRWQKVAVELHPKATDPKEIGRAHV